MNIDKKYSKIYEKYSSKDKLIKEIYSIVKLNTEKTELVENEKIIYDTTYSVVAPTLVLFVYETMLKAKENGINRLYFLARDGYMPYQIAKIINTIGFNMDIRYLYCSRLSLRRPLYFKFDDYNLDLMFSRNRITTIETILTGIGFEKEENIYLYNKMKIPNLAIDKVLNMREIEIVKDKIQLIKEEITGKSKSYFDDTYEYFKQEGLLDSIQYGIVDSGWTGSMQESIIRLLKEFGNKTTDIEGFYFGIFRNNDVNSNSRYNGWYFDNSSRISTIAKFNINLFESLTISPHGMTLYYGKDNKNNYAPVLKGNKVDFESTFEKIEYKEIINFTNQFIKNINLKDNKIYSVRREFVEKLLNELMYRPSINESVIYGSINFSDAPTEDNMEGLCRPLNKYELISCLLPMKVIMYIYNRLFVTRKSPNIFMPFWSYGSITISDTKCKELFRNGMYQINYLYAYKNRKNNLQ